MRHRGLSLLKGGAIIIYSLFKLLPKQHKLVLISRLQNYSSIDFQYIAHKATVFDPKLKVVMLNHKMSNKFFHVFAILQEMYHLATAEACVVESYVISVSILKHRPSLIIVQIWHALGAVKAFGHMTIGKAEGSSAFIASMMDMHRNYTYVTASSPIAANTYAKAFNVPRASVITIGMPRVDYLLDQKIQIENSRAIRERYNLPSIKQVVLYAPTFRKGATIPYEKLIAAVDTSRYSLIIKQHPRDRTTIAATAGVIVDRNFDLLQLLPAADIVITDYSATVFEAALLGKPLFFWTFDEVLYGKRRGFAFDHKQELPGFQSGDAATLMAAIDRDEFDSDKINAFAKRHVTQQDGNCTARLFNLLGLAS